MKITRIVAMHNCRVFDDFSWPRDGSLDDFGKFNLIYGWNGSGKSTISHILRCLEHRQPVRDGDVRLVVDGRPTWDSEFPALRPSTAGIKVFNQEFVKASVFRTNDDEMDPIYVVGTTGVDAQQQIDTRQADQTTENAKLATAQSRESDAQASLDRHSPARAKEIKHNLGGREDPVYRNYDRRSYEERANQMLRNGDAASHQLSDADRDRLSELQRERPKDKIEPPSYKSINVTALSLRVQQLLQQPVAPTGAIQALLQDPILAGWIEQGRRLHAIDASGNCLYCTQHLPQERIEAIEQHFNDEVQRLNDAVDTAIDDLESAVADIDRVRSGWWNSAIFYADLRESYESAQDTADSYLAAVRTHIDDLITSLRKKRTTPHERIPMPALTTGVSESPMESVVAVVQNHNRQCDKFDERIKSARQRLEADAVAASLPEYRELVSAREKAKSDRRDSARQIDAISIEIAALQQQIRNYQLPAEKLNRDLHQYLGHSQLQLDVREQGYVIRRDGQIARDLSEGETTAIALLYFLRSLDADEFDLHKGTVVLDDPVSSLDANALYMASAFIRERTRDSGQLFVLTHNFTFFREMRNWFQYLNAGRGKGIPKRSTQTYMLRRTTHNDKPRSRITPLDPLLQDYESEYHYLFSLVYRAATTPSDSLEGNYEMPNVCRRLLESFLAFKYPGVQSDRLQAKMDQVEFDGTKKKQILRFVNAHSHKNEFDAPQDDLSHLAETGLVLQHILELIEAVDEGHFRGLVDRMGD